MKKIIALLLAICVVASTLSACGGNEQPLSTSDPKQEAQPAESEATPETTQPETTQPETTAPSAELVESVVYDADGIKITATKLVEDDIWGNGVSFLVENNTERNLSFSGDYFVVNGVTVYGMLYIDVAAGKKANGSVLFSHDELNRAGITEFATISTYNARMVDTDSYDTVADVTFDLATTLAGNYTQNIDETGDIVFDQDGVTVIAQITSDSFYGNVVQMLTKNNTGKDIIIQAENVSVNGFTIDAWMYDTVFHDSVRYCQLDIFQDSLDENGIEAIEEVTFTVRVIESDTYDSITESGELKVYVAE